METDDRWPWPHVRGTMTLYATKGRLDLNRYKEVHRELLEWRREYEGERKLCSENEER